MASKRLDEPRVPHTPTGCLRIEAPEVRDQQGQGDRRRNDEDVADVSVGRRERQPPAQHKEADSRRSHGQHETDQVRHEVLEIEYPAGGDADRREEQDRADEKALRRRLPRQRCQHSDDPRSQQQCRQHERGIHRHCGLAQAEAADGLRDPVVGCDGSAEDGEPRTDPAKDQPRGGEKRGCGNRQRSEGSQRECHGVYFMY